MPNGYAFQKQKEHIVKASGRNLGISTKQSIEIETDVVRRVGYGEVNDIEIDNTEEE